MSRPTRAGESRAARRPRAPGALAAAVLLSLAGLAWLAHLRVAVSGDHSWDSGRPSATVRVTAGRTYDVSSRDGLRLLVARQGTSDVRISCTFSTAAGRAGDLNVTPLAYDERVLHRLATFVAPLNGDVAVACPDAGPVWVDSADDARFDTAGLLVLATVGLTLAGGLLGVRVITHRPSTPPRPTADGPAMRR